MARFPQKDRMTRMWVTIPAYEQMTAIKQAMTLAKGRNMTYADVLDELLEHWAAVDKITREAGR